MEKVKEWGEANRKHNTWGKQCNCLPYFLTVNMCRSGKTTSQGETLMHRPNASQAGVKLLISFECFCRKGCYYKFPKTAARVADYIIYNYIIIPHFHMQSSSSADMLADMKA